MAYQIWYKDTNGQMQLLVGATSVPTALSQLSDDSTHRLVTDSEKSTWNSKGTYSKPSGGIPKTDLASAVQTSLGKADTALQSHQDISGKANTSDLGTAAYKNTGTSSGNVPVLDSNGKLASSVLPAIAITDTFVVSSQASMLALTAEVGDVCVRTDLNKSYILKEAGASTLSHWQELLTPTDAVTSVNGQTGAVTINIPNTLPASDVYSWAKASTKPSYSYSEISGTPSSLPASDVYNWAKQSTKPSYNFDEIGNRYDTLSSFSSSAPNIVGSVSAFGMAMSSEHGANRLAFINPDALNLEYSTDGSNFSTMTALSNSDKVALVTGTANLPVGRNSNSAEYNVNSKTRLTIIGQDASNHYYLYCSPKKLLINVSSSGGMTVTVECRTGSSVLNNGSWTYYNEYSLSGWSGWNEIPLVLNTLGGGYNQTDNYWQVRLTFKMTSKNSSYPTTATVNAIRLFADNCWNPPSTMASINRLYGFDTEQNALFPAQVYVAGNKRLARVEEIPSSLPASDVYSWAKASTKPSYSWSEIGSKPSFSTVATSGSYNDLSNKPTIPTNTNQLTNGAGFITSSGSCSHAGNATNATHALEADVVNDLYIHHIYYRVESGGYGILFTTALLSADNTPMTSLDDIADYMREHAIGANPLSHISASIVFYDDNNYEWLGGSSHSIWYANDELWIEDSVRILANGSSYAYGGYYDYDSIPIPTSGYYFTDEVSIYNQ